MNYLGHIGEESGRQCEGQSQRASSKFDFTCECYKPNVLFSYNTLFIKIIL